VPDRIPLLIRSIAEADTPSRVLDALHNAGPLNVLDSYPLFNPQEPPEPGKTILYHRSTPLRFRSQHQALSRDIGLSRLTRYTLNNPPPFTITEARRKLQPVGSDQWVFDLLNDYGIRDGFVVPYGGWAVVYWSERVLGDRFGKDRMMLEAASSAAIHRLNQLTPKKPVRSVNLSPRELAVLEHLVRGLRVRQIARQMGLAVPTVRTHLQNVRKKLNAKTLAQAAMIGVRRGIV